MISFMVMKKVNKKTTRSNLEIQRYLGALHEEHIHALKGIREGHDIIIRRLDGHDEKFEGIDKKFEGIDKKFEGIDKKFEGIDKKLNSHTEMMGKILTDLGIVKEDIEFIKRDLKKKVDVDEFTTLEIRVSRLESKVK